MLFGTSSSIIFDDDDDGLQDHQLQNFYIPLEVDIKEVWYRDSEAVTTVGETTVTYHEHVTDGLRKPNFAFNNVLLWRKQYREGLKQKQRLMFCSV
ncbi:hypothetical protein Tco_1285204 [Tanacetum coccineum]